MDILLKANICKSNEKYQEAIILYNETLKIDPNFCKSLSKKGMDWFIYFKLSLDL